MKPIFDAIDFQADTSCSICSRKGVWPYMLFEEAGEIVSTRPSDVAAVITHSLDYYPSVFKTLVDEEFKFEVFCPNCYRISSKAEENNKPPAFAHCDPAEVKNLIEKPIKTSNGLTLDRFERICKEIADESFGSRLMGLTFDSDGEELFALFSEPVSVNDDEGSGDCETWALIDFAISVDYPQKNTMRFKASADLQIQSFFKEKECRLENIHGGLCHPKQAIVIVGAAYRFLDNLAAQIQKLREEK